MIHANDVDKGRVFTQGFKKITPDSIDLKKVLRVYVLRALATQRVPHNGVFERLLEELTKRRYQAIVVLPRSTPDVEKRPVDLPKPSIQSPDISLIDIFGFNIYIL